MADGGRLVLAYIDESTWGTTPSAAGVKVAYATSEDFGLDVTTTLTQAIRGDYQKPNVVRTGATGRGSFNFELAYGDTDSFIEDAMRSTWSADIDTAATTLSAVDATNKYTRGAGSFVTDGWVVGMAGRASGFSTAANNGVFVVTAVDATNLTVTGIDLADETGGGDEALTNDGYIKQGTTLDSFTIERQFADLTTTFISQKGARVSGYSLSAQTGQIITGSVSFISKAPSAVASATVGSGAYTASPGDGNEVMNGIDHVTGIYESDDDTTNTTAVTYCVSQIDLNIGSPMRPIECLGTLGPSAIGGNSFEITGSFRVYLDDASKGLWDDFVNYTEKALIWRFVDTAGNMYVFNLPQVQFTAMDGPNSSGPDSDIMLNASWTAEYDTGAASQIVISRIDA